MKTNINTIANFTVSRYLWTAALITSTLSTFLAVWLLIGSYQDFSNTKIRNDDFHEISRLVTALNIYARERGYANELIFSDASLKQDSLTALKQAQAETDKSIALNRSLFTPQQWDKITTSKQKARQQVLVYGHTSILDPEKAKSAITAMQQATSVFRTIMFDVIESLHMGSSSGNSLIKLVTITSVRDASGLMAGTLLTSLHFNTIPSNDEIELTARRLERIQLGWQLLTLTNDNIPDNKKFDLLLTQTIAHYQEKTEPWINHLKNKTTQDTKPISTYEFAKLYRITLLDLEALQNEYMSQLILQYEHEEKSALIKFTLVSITLATIIILLSAMVIYIQRSVLKPISELNRFADKLRTDLSTKSDSKNNKTNELESLSNTLDFLGQQVQDQKSLNYQLKKESEEDPLTGLANRRKFTKTALELLENNDKGNTTTLILIDLDHFKRVNDTWGHPTGDLVLVEVAKVLRDCAPEQALATRIGGEEFAVIYQAEHPEEIQALLTSMQDRIRELVIQTEDGQSIKVTASFGVSSAINDTLDILLSDADKALYKAKSKGRDCIYYA